MPRINQGCANRYSLGSNPNATRPGRIHIAGTRQNVPSHLPQTMVLAVSGVDRRISRVWETRSSANDVTATTLNSSRPTETCNPFTQAAIPPPLQPPLYSTFRAMTLKTAPNPPYRIQSRRVHRLDSLRCHSRQNTGL